LSGKYTRENLKDSENRLAGFDFLPFDKEAGFKVVEKMREIAERHEASVAQIAIAWLLAKPIVSTVIIGPTKSHKLKDNRKAVDLNLGVGEVAELDAGPPPTPVYPNWFNANLIDAQHKSAIEAE